MSHLQKKNRGDNSDITTDNNEFIANGIVVHNCGKTLQAIIAAVLGQFKNVFIVCPNSLKFNWRNELSCFVESSHISIITNDSIPNTQFTIVNYDKLSKLKKQLL